MTYPPAGSSAQQCDGGKHKKPRSNIAFNAFESETFT